MGTVGVFFGGRSSEHRVSIDTANALVPILSTLDHHVVWVYTSEKGRLLVCDTATADSCLDSDTPVELLDRLPEYRLLLSPGTMRLDPITESLPHFDIDVVLPLFHGAIGEDGSIQGLCRFFDITCAGPTVLGAAVGLDKAISKSIVRDHGIPVPDYTIVDIATTDLTRPSLPFDGPYVVKPRSQGSSIGVSFACDRSELDTAITAARRFGTQCLVEQYVEAVEVHCYVLKTSSIALTSRISGKAPDTPIYSYESKLRTSQRIRRLVDSDFDADIVERVQQQARTVFDLLDGRGLARVDFFLRDNGELLFNELNSIPGLRRSPAYGSFNSWANHGIEFRDAVAELLRP
ncbi:D-alanine--D-alanine ligase family protein [Nocardia pseudobrasiliensis]|uniref:D-alanine--D-alanine ligase n=1 Tax=Nocardia pseudobrasiliensis TaxID=45979 RepID=A0A370ICE2_9NOCA|nr:ATP-grasp domain-containing protein [Nocardia pseudobrasiliensis]RDI68408.1 D-alanine-D-alanine ligase [Nocardia pseudobrasiliensis]